MLVFSLRQFTSRTSHYTHFLQLLSTRQRSKIAVVKISASEQANRFKSLLRYISALKDSWSPVAQSMAVMSRGFRRFRRSPTTNTGHNSNGRRYKAPRIFHCGLGYWEPDGTIAVAPSRDFYHRSLKRKFLYSSICLLQTAVTCCYMFYERVRTSFSYSRAYVQFAHDVITKI